MSTHAFSASADDPDVCGHRAVDAPGYAGGICGLRASNRAVHAPGAKQVRHLSIVRTADVTLPHRDSKRFEIVGAFAHPARVSHGFTCAEVEQHTGWSHRTVWDALNDLKNDGIIAPLLDDNGERVTRPTKASGAAAAVYVLTADGRAAYTAESTSMGA
jgi:hypothetical protein